MLSHPAPAQCMLCLDLYLVLVQSGSQTQPAPPPGEVSASSSHSDNTDQSSLTGSLSTGGRSGEQEEREGWRSHVVYRLSQSHIGVQSVSELRVRILITVAASVTTQPSPACNTHTYLTETLPHTQSQADHNLRPNTILFNTNKTYNLLTDQYQERAKTKQSHIGTNT